ncbi:MAG: hypothetical protein RR561_08375 [Peptostreptococcus sp.]|uniref:hypothetical protein n=1 Tax=Peptostreptococcus sp. TaxID=1262 RepID=UPI002FC7691A
MKNKGKIDNMFDENLEKKIQKSIDEEYSADNETKKRIRQRLEDRIKAEESKYEKSRDDTDVDNIATYDDMDIDDIDAYKEDFYNSKKNEKKKVISFLDKGSRKNKTKKRKVMAASIAAFVLVIGLGTSLTIGKDFFTVTKEYHSGKLTVVEEEYDVNPSEIEMTLPNELDGKVFDKNGKPVKKINGAMKVLYDENGEKIKSLPIDGNGNYKEEEQDVVEYINYKTVEEAEKVLDFKPKVLEGFNINKIEVMKDKETGEISGKYATVYQSKGKDMVTISERVASEETAYVTDGDDIKYVDIQGNKGILSNSYNIDVDTGDTFIAINAKYSHYRNDELVKLSQSLK